MGDFGAEIKSKWNGVTLFGGGDSELCEHQKFDLLCEKYVWSMSWSPFETKVKKNRK